METPSEIELVGIEQAQSREVRAEIERHIAQLEQRFGRITSCRVAVRGDGRRNGSRYEVTIHLALPNHQDVSVDYSRPADKRSTEVRTAVSDAFKRARRQLQDRVRRMERLVKHHEPTPVGRVLRIDPSGDFGFIATSDGREVYFHKNSVLNGAFARLRPGASVAFSEEGEKGAQASTVKPTSKRPLVDNR